MGLFGDDADPRPQRDEAPTEAMAARLARHGINAAGMTRRQAGAMLGNLKGKLTPKQQKTLGDAGEDIGVCPEKAHALLCILRDRGWRPRDFLLLANRWFVRKRGTEFAVVFYDPTTGRDVPMGRRFKTEDAARKFVGACVEEAERPGGPATLFVG